MDEPEAIGSRRVVLDETEPDGGVEAVEAESMSAPMIGATSVTANSRPTIAASSTARVACESSRIRRRATAWLTVGGRSSESWPASRCLAISVAKNGCRRSRHGYVRRRPG